MSNEQNNYPDYHPLIDGRRAGYGDEEVYTCDECGKPFLAEEAAWSIWNGQPICPRCHRIQQEER
jgi:formylmethanofuran dehydrogenase subunit E